MDVADGHVTGTVTFKGGVNVAGMGEAGSAI